MNEIKSIWDGWEKQLYGMWSDNDGGYCAAGYLENKTPAAWEVVPRVVKRLREIYPEIPYSCDYLVIVYANNELRLTPEDFRRIDRETQIEVAVKPLVDSVPTFLVTDANEGEALTKLAPLEEKR